MGSLTVRKLYTLMTCALMGLALAGALAMLEAKPAYAADATLTYHAETGTVVGPDDGSWEYKTDPGNSYLKLTKGGTLFTIQAVDANGDLIPLPDAIQVIVESGSTIANTGKGIAGEVLCNGSAIKDGLFLGPVTNGHGNPSTISGGEFEGPVDNKDHSVINGGTFNGPVTNRLSSTISDGTFNGSVNNYAPRPRVLLETELGGTIEGGTFNGLVVNGTPVPIDNNPSYYLTDPVGTITDGTFNGPVDNGHGTISGGTFNKKVTNGYVEWYFSSDLAGQKALLTGLIDGGTFGATVDNRRFSSITDGTFNNKVINRLGGSVLGSIGGSFTYEQWVTVHANNLGTNPGLVSDEEGNTYIAVPGTPGSASDVVFELAANVTGFGKPLSASDVRISRWDDENTRHDTGLSYDLTANKVTIPAATFNTAGEIVVEAWGVPTSPAIAHGGWVVQPGSANDGDELVALTAEAESVELYYTTDGTDPRKATSPNELSRSAKRYEGVFAVPRGTTTTIKAVAVKTYDGGVQRIGVPTEQSFTPAIYALATEGFPWVKGVANHADAKLIVTGNALDRASLAVFVDGALVDATHYTVVMSMPGRAVITFKPAFMDGLADGAHIAQVTFADGSASANFSVRDSRKLASTGDAATPLAVTSAAALASALICGGAAFTLARRRS